MLRQIVGQSHVLDTYYNKEIPLQMAKSYVSQKSERKGVGERLSLQICRAAPPGPSRGKLGRTPPVFLCPAAGDSPSLTPNPAWIWMQISGHILYFLRCLKMNKIPATMAQWLSCGVFPISLKPLGALLVTLLAPHLVAPDVAHGAGLRADRLGRVVPRHVPPLHPQHVDRQLLSLAGFDQLQSERFAVRERMW